MTTENQTQPQELKVNLGDLPVSAVEAIYVGLGKLPAEAVENLRAYIKNRIIEAAKAAEAAQQSEAAKAVEQAQG